ncbi:MAG: hypothetical protein ABW223_02600 [Rariglobus sp.]
MPASTPNIDVVYTWVDGTRPDYLQLLGRHASGTRDLNPERYRDAYDCLRHSLRSLELYAPWVRTIYLVTCRPQVPAWLRLDHPRLRVVHHDEIMGNDVELPTFNSNVIESFLHRIPGISKQFLYFNDDYFLGAPITPLDFLTADGRIRVFGTMLGEHARWLVYEKQPVYFGLVEHGPILIDRDEWAAMQVRAGSEFKEFLKHRFRRPDNFRPERLYRWHLLTQRRAQSRIVPFWEYLRHSAFHKIKPGPARQRQLLARLAQRRPKFICLNDDLGFPADPAVIAEVRAFLAQMFPQPSSFETGAPS